MHLGLDQTRSGHEQCSHATWTMENAEDEGEGEGEGKEQAIPRSGDV